MRDCVFLVADSQIEAMVRGFFGRAQFNQSLGCGAFDFDPRLDLVVDPHRDPGVYTRGHQLLATYRRTHNRAVVMLDAEWDGAPAAAEIREKIGGDLGALWTDYQVVVLDPEIEAWIWQDNVNITRLLGVDDYPTLRAELEARGLWQADQPKPHRPKEAVDYALRRARKPRSAALYQEVAATVSVKGCIDPAFQSLQTGLKGWFGEPS